MTFGAGAVMPAPMKQNVNTKSQMEAKFVDVQIHQQMLGEKKIQMKIRQDMSCPCMLPNK